jgi:proteasome assembly chaperone (PAC2) family protein
LNRTYLRIFFQPSLRNPIFVVGLPSVGNVGVATVNLLAEHSQAKLFAELYTPALPDYAIVDEDGLCSLLRYRILISTLEANLAMLIGDMQPPVEDLPSYYEICGDILDVADKFNCDFIITLDGLPAIPTQREIYVAGTSGKIASEYVSLGAKLYSGGRIIGLSGLLLGLAKLRGIDGICLLSPVADLVSDPEAALNMYKFLRKALKFTSEKMLHK